MKKALKTAKPEAKPAAKAVAMGKMAQLMNRKVMAGKKSSSKRGC